MSTKKKSSVKKCGKERKVKPDLSKYRGLDPKKNTRVRQEFLDADYLDKLSPEQLKYYDKFCTEYYNNSFERDETGEWSEDNLFDIRNNDSLRKELNRDNNTRNSDAFGGLRAAKQLIYLENSVMESVIEAQQYSDLNHFDESMAELSEPEKKARRKRKKMLK